MLFFAEGDGEKKPLEQHQIKPICNARSGNQTGTRSPLRHPCPPPLGKYPQTFLSPPPLPLEITSRTTFVFYLRTLPLNIMPPTSIWTLHLDITFWIFSPDLILRTFPMDIPDEHSPQLTPSLPWRILLICLFVCLFFFFTVFLGIYKGFTARRHKNLQELYKGTLGMTCLFYSFIHWFIFFSFYLLLFSCVFCIYDSSLLKPRQVMVIVLHLNDSLSRLKFPTPLCFPSRNTRYGTRFYGCVTGQIGTVLNLPIRAPRSLYNGV